MPVTPWETFKALGDLYADERRPKPVAERQETNVAPAEITDHEFVNYAPEGAPNGWMCQFVYLPDNPEYADPSGGWMMGGPIECGGSREQHTKEN